MTLVLLDAGPPASTFVAHAADAAWKIAGVLLAGVLALLLYRARGFVRETVAADAAAESMHGVVWKAIESDLPRLRKVNGEAHAAEMKANRRARARTRRMAEDLAATRAETRAVRLLAEGHGAILQEVSGAIDRLAGATDRHTAAMAAAEERERETTKLLQRTLGALEARGIPVPPVT